MLFARNIMRVQPKKIASNIVYVLAQRLTHRSQQHNENMPPL
jgi:type II secretory ATPase GspE/PulE/Tfp pilus assembly ATPase PilB-like protein